MAQESDISSRIIKENSDTLGDILLSSHKDGIKILYFPKALKQANIIPVFKKGERYLKNNYKPVSILPLMCPRFLRNALSNV